MLRYARELKPDIRMISYNGAVITDLKEDSYFEQTLTQAQICLTHMIIV
jgi:hydroxymethylpyrimidine pyrophosphatase-like HAD family hydrolase